MLRRPCEVSRCSSTAQDTCARHELSLRLVKQVESYIGDQQQGGASQLSRLSCTKCLYSKTMSVAETTHPI